MPNDTALLIIDVQKGLFDLDPPLHDGEGVLATIKSLIDKAHATNTPVIYVQHNGGAKSVLRPDRPGFPIHPAIAPATGDPIFRKNHPDAFQGTELQSYLESHGLKHLVVVGIQSDYCVDTTTRRAYSLGFDVTLVQDGHSTWGDDAISAPQIIAHHNIVLGDSFATLKSAREITFGAPGA
ncbi:MAG: cysteine hydrolase [Chloroflexi bacterium]|nr:cysteine hydrolase [Chloroflexota bacterium]